MNHFLTDRSSVSLSDLPINPPAPELDNYFRPDENAPLSNPPSPFLSKEIYLHCHKSGLEQVAFFLIILFTQF